jgi:hypothetical protein
VDDMLGTACHCMRADEPKTLFFLFNTRCLTSINLTLLLLHFDLLLVSERFCQHACHKNGDR